MNKNIKISLVTDNNSINSDSTLSLIIGHKQFFFNNANSWQKLTTDASFIKIEYLCLLDKQTTDILEIVVDDWIYKIHLSKNILTKNLNTYSLNCYIDLHNCTFKKDTIDYSSYNEQIFCYHQIKSEQIPPIGLSIYDHKYNFNNWYNYDNSLLFLSKDDTNNTNASIQIFPTKSIFYMVTHHEHMKQDIIFYSVSHHFVPSNEIGQMDCTAIPYGFYSLQLLEPIIIAPESYYDINNISSNIKIFQNI